MRVSLNIGNYSWPGGPASFGRQLKRVVRAAGDAGLDTVWVPDHLIQADPSAAPSTDMLEAYTTLGFLAGEPSPVRLGTMVTAVTYRPPSLLIKAVTTLDVLSGGPRLAWDRGRLPRARGAPNGPAATCNRGALRAARGDAEARTQHVGRR